MPTRNRPFVVGLGGGTGAGKTTLAQGIVGAFSGDANLIKLDNYYLNEDVVPRVHGMPVWDHPDAWRHEDYAQALSELVGQVTQRDHPEKSLIVADGFLQFGYPEVRRQLDLAIWLEAPFEERVARRVLQWPDRYKPGMLKDLHERYIEPTREQADVIIDVSDKDQQAVLGEAIELIEKQIHQ